MLSAYTDSRGTTWLAIDKDLYYQLPDSDEPKLALANIGYVVNMIEKAQGRLILNASDTGLFEFNTTI